MLENDAYKEIDVFTGTKEDVFNAVDLLVGDLGFSVITTEEEVRTVESVDDVQSGDIIPFMTPEKNEIGCIGCDVGWSNDDMQRIVSIIGRLNHFPNEVSVGVNLFRLEEDHTRRLYDTFMSNLKDEYVEVTKNFRDVVVIESTKEELFKYLTKRQEENKGSMVTMYQTDSDVDQEYKIDEPEAIENGMFLIAQLQREDGSPQMGIVGYDVADEKIQEYLSNVLKGLGKGNIAEDSIEVKRINFSEIEQ